MSTTSNETITLLKDHRSVRRYAPDRPVPDADIRTAVEAGQSASTSSAVQSYCLLHVTDPAHRRRLVELTGHQTKVERCGAFFVVCGDTRRHRLACTRAGVPYDARLEAFLVAVVDASLFAQNLVVAFESMGYGICYVGGLRDRLPDVQRMLGFPSGVYPLYGLCVGVPDERPAARPRLAPEAVCFRDRYPTDDEVLAHLDEYDGRYAAYLAERGATPGGWSPRMADLFAGLRRPDLAAYYASQGADLG
jgi:FMN reductase (NADPH)